MKRVARTVVLVLAIGALVNVVVAMGCAALASAPPDDLVIDLEWRESDIVWWKATCPFDDVDAPIEPPPRDLPKWSPENEGAMVSYIYATPPSSTVSFYFAGVDAWRISSSYDRITCVRVRAGWPIRSLECAHWVDSGHQSTNGKRVYFANGFEITLPTPSEGQEAVEFFLGRRAIPYGIMWPGFVVNSLLYGLIAWTAVALVLSARRKLRVVRHRCPLCGYPFGTSATCTECGRDVSKWVQPKLDASPTP